MLGGKNKQPLGYTIIEVMIVLAVSGLMFVIAATFINGKQEKTAFTAGVNEMASRLQDTIEQVVDGRFSDIPLTCAVGSSNLSFTSAGSPNQGLNQDCIFLGKMLHFSEGGNDNHYETFTLAGSRLDSSGALATSLTGAVPTPVDVPYSSGGASAPVLTTQQSLPQGLTAKVKINSSITNYSFGFVQSLGSLNAGVLQSGAQNTGLVYATTENSPNDSETAAAQKIGDNTPNTHLQSAQQASLCVTDGSRYAIITVGSNNAQLSVSVKQLGVVASCPPSY